MNNNFSNIFVFHCIGESEESHKTTLSIGKPATDVGCEVVQHANTLRPYIIHNQNFFDSLVMNLNIG